MTSNAEMFRFDDVIIIAKNAEAVWGLKLEPFGARPTCVCVGLSRLTLKGWSSPKVGHAKIGWESELWIDFDSDENMDK